VVVSLDGAPAVPTVRAVELGGRGTCQVWECGGPPGAPCLVLLHGVTMTAELGWSQIMPALGQHYRVIAPDLRGHGGGIPSGPAFRLEDCADDVAALADVLGIERLVAVGYSMGGMVAQLLWRRHRALVQGLVLTATARNVRGSPLEQMGSLALPLIASSMSWNPMAAVVTSTALGTSLLGYIDDPTTRLWASRQLGRTSLASALSAAQAVSSFTSHEWIGEVDVPTAVVVTTQDRLVPVSRQRKLAAALPHPTVLELAAGHGVCVTSPGPFGQVILEACQSVLAHA
jgi:3-oxoadipate enol-lactonase